MLASGGYGNVFFLSTNAMGSNVTATWRAHRKGAYMANPCYTQIHPTCIPVSGDHQSKLTLMSESLRNDGRIWVPKKVEDCDKDPRDIPEEDRDYYLERIYPAFGNLVPRDIASRAAKYMCDDGRGVGPAVREVDKDGNEQMVRRGVYLDFADAIARLGEDAVREKYDNLFDMYERITGENPYQVPMRIYPAVHYVMGGLWVDYHLQSNDPRPVRGRRGELLRPRCQPARRLGTDAGPGRRLLRPAEHHPRLPRGRPVRADRGGPPRGRGGPPGRRAADLQVPLHQRDPQRRQLPQGSWATSCGSTAAWSGPSPVCARRST